jgi:hypothetical protein
MRGCRGNVTLTEQSRKMEWRAAMDKIVDWLGFYSSRRLHSTLDYVCPMTFEQNWFAAPQGEAA